MKTHFIAPVSRPIHSCWRTWIALALIAAFLAPASLHAKGIVSLHSFDAFNSGGDNKDGGVPEAPLLAAPDHYLYGTTSAGGQFGDGTIFRMSRTGAGKILHSFQNTDNGFYQYSGLTLGPDGNFYGTTVYGGANGNGSIYQITPTGTYNTIYSFSLLTNSTNLDGAQPWAGLVYDSATGLFYGTTQAGGNSGYGTVFSVSTAGTLVPMYSFANAVTGNSPLGDGNTPQFPLAIGPDGALYGTTAGGGSYEAGTAFRITTANSFTTIHVFTQQLDGGQPSILTLGSDQNFYSTAKNGGANNFGCVFSITTTGSVANLYSFTEGSDGAFPEGGVIFGPDGQLYGTTSNAGAGGNAAGTVFSLSPKGGTPNTIYTFGNIWREGAYPVPTLVNGPVGRDRISIYGATTNGGRHGSGTIFGLAPAAPGSVAFSGVYDGLVSGTAGYISLNVNAKSKFTGKVIIAGVSHSVKGQFSSTGAWDGSSSGGAIALSLQLGGTSGNFLISGTAGSTALTAYHTVYGKGHFAPEAGEHTVHLTPTTSGSSVPPGTGVAILHVTKTGGIRFAGRLPDGTPFSASTAIVGGPSGDQCPIYSTVKYKDPTPAGTRGLVIGAITFPSGALTGPLLWIKPAQTKGQFPAAVTTGLTLSP